MNDKKKKKEDSIRTNDSRKDESTSNGTGAREEEVREEMRAHDFAVDQDAPPEEHAREKGETVDRDEEPDPSNGGEAESEDRLKPKWATKEIDKELSKEEEKEE